LSETWVKQEDGIIIFSKPNVSAEVFEVVLRIALDKHDGVDILNLLMAADELILHDLFGYIQQHLVTYKVQWMEDNFDLVRRTVFQNDRLKRLQEYCVARISTIQQCIPLVRIFQISSNDFHSRIMPYRDIIPKALFEDVMRYHMVPDCPRPLSLMPSRRGGIESNLLRSRHAALISSWIDRNDLNAFYNTTSDGEDIKAALLSRVQEPSRA
ncbi:2725_t:CDS:2, partial [Cetraspora pellucida]